MMFAATQAKRPVESLRRIFAVAVLAGVLIATYGAAAPAGASAADISCWTRGAYLDVDHTAQGIQYGHKSVCNAPHVVVTDLKRDGVIVSSYTSPMSTQTTAGNWVSTGSKRFFTPLPCNERFQTVVKVYQQPRPVGGPTQGSSSMYWTSGTPQKCAPGILPVISPPS